MYLSLAGQRAPWRNRGAASVPFRLSPVILWLGIVSLLTDVSSEAVAAVLPVYLTGALGLSILAYGFLDGLQQGISAVIRIAAGWTSDTLDRPKWVAAAGYGLSMAARAGLLLSASVGAVASVITLDRIGKGIRTAPRDALITTAAQPEHLARSFGVHRMLDTVGATAGPLLAFGILLVIPQGYSTVFVFSLGAAILGVAVMVLLVPNLRTRQAAGRSEPAVPQSEPGGPAQARLPRPTRRQALRELNTPTVRRLLLAAGVLSLLSVGDGFLYLLLLTSGGFNPVWFPLLFVGTNAAYLLLAIPLGRAADRWGRKKVFLLGHVGLLAAYACAGFGGLGATLMCLFALGAFYAATDGVLAALMGGLVPARVRATGIAAAQTVVAVGRLLASSLFGVLWYTLGPETALWTAAATLAAVLPGAAWLIRSASTRKPVPADAAETAQ
ncbi:MFS transporter [Arthrobacter caoxuetaonis]|uniref:MFS transporter n=1 Tax=Arthrobacter caoxuetaonis TaxID=2886935 RepID=A0A9X1MC65_9MICC|nr:MFS transporter [Arthrobacter caoxuetaonis]MCC3297248.1 MFS transporter [Arthrobacter caoxuetaonis]USQ58195.1 MFS transporter [Arthrobacter caoxuetaonis]